MRRTRTLRIGTEQLARMLNVPTEGRVLYVGTEIDPHSVVVVVEHPEYEEVPDNVSSPFVRGEVKIVEHLDRRLGEVVGTPFYRWELQP